MDMRRNLVVALALCLFAAAPVLAQEDAEGCKDHPLFTRFPNMVLSDCESSQFDLRGFPVGQMKPGKDTLDSVEVEGPVQFLAYQLKEGTTPPSGLQIMRNLENAAKKAGGTIEGQWPGWCKANYDDERMPRMGNTCTSYALTMRFVKGGKETWVFLQASEREGSYQMTISEREAMKQDVAVNEIADQLNKDGFVALYVNFDTGKATIRPDSAKTLDDAAAALKTVPAMRIEVGGHTDNVGTPEANQKLSQERAQAVMAALVQRGIKADRMTAKGYGQTKPIADNRTEEGRGKNRRVELVRK
jgi:outer membrane protein OmpA-like peptidoglycan-associated protein